MVRTFLVVLPAVLILWVACSDRHSNSAPETVSDGDVAGPADLSPAERVDADEEQSDAPVEWRPQPPLGFCAPNDAPFPQRPEVMAQATLPFLHVEGRSVVDEEGTPVALRGVNFGSWLMMESWIAGIGALDEGDLLDMLRQRAAELGLADLLADAEAETVADWVFEKQSHWVLVMQWRDYMSEHATADRAAAVSELWDWFMTLPWVEEEEALWEWLAGRFGYPEAESLRLLFQQHYVTELDVKRVADLGLNLIRVPIWYRTLETDFETDNDFRPEGWEMLHKLALWARTHGLYLMLDLHGAPGGQSTSWHQGLKDGGHLWNRPDCVARTTRLWQAMASYFADDPHVAVYDLLNEPMAFPQPEDYRAVHEAIYSAIRAVDAKHIVMIEDAYRPIGQISSPAEMGWENAMFSIHLYPGGTSAADYLARIEADLSKLGEVYSERFDCPLFLGEFNSADGTDAGSWAAEGMDLVLARLNERGIHWAPWTWKYYANYTWGIYHPAENEGVKVDVANWSLEEIHAAFKAMDSAGYVPTADYAKAFSSNADAPVAPLLLAPP